MKAPAGKAALKDRTQRDGASEYAAELESTGTSRLRDNAATVQRCFARPLPDWYHRLRAQVDACTCCWGMKPLMVAAKDWRAIARYRQDAQAEALADELYDMAIQRGADLHDQMTLAGHAPDEFAHCWGPPDDFLRLYKWQWEDRPRDPRTLFNCRGITVARLYQHPDSGQWRATLDVHREPDAQRTRVCTSYDDGRAGVEQWAARHNARLLDDAMGMLLGAAVI